MADARYELIEPFIEHQGERRGFWLRVPRPVGDRILIARKGCAVPAAHRDRAVVFLDVRAAFGTGGHGTTEGCLAALGKHVRGGETVLDVGTGTGILAIAARKLGAGHVTAADIDGAACAETRKNIVLNGIEGGIEVIEGSVGAVSGAFDIVAANLRTRILVALMEEIVGKLKPSGIAIFSGILERELLPFLSFLGGHPLEPPETHRIHGWMTLVAVRGPGTPRDLEDGRPDRRG